MSPNPSIHICPEEHQQSAHTRPLQSPPQVLTPIMSSHQEEGISSLLSGLQVDNRDRDQTILAHAQSIANLKTQARRTEDIICKNDDTIKELRHLLVFTNDVNKMPVQFPKEL
jgi:hypothetical protein